MRQLLCEGAVVDVAGALLGEPAVLYKEKVNHKLPGGAGYAPHQDAPAYPMIDTHVSAMIAGRLRPRAARSKSCRPASRCSRSTTGLHRAGSGCTAGVAAVARAPGRRCGSTAGRHTGAGRTARRARRALYPTYNAARSGDRRAEYYARKRAAFASAAPGDRARVSLIGDFEGRSV